MVAISSTCSLAQRNPLTVRASHVRPRAGLRAAMLLLALCAACAPVLSKTPIDGDRDSISQLVGRWEGNYSSTATGRSGQITFELRAGTDTAQGDVMMTSRSNDPVGAYSGGDVMLAPRQSSRVLTIRFVRVRGDEVLGVLDPYTDPVCGCLLQTRFLGRLRGNEIKGTFETRSADFFHHPTAGEWSVRRVHVRIASAGGDTRERWSASYD